jgi:DNA-binding NarL/FixJ family response regulator
VIRTIVVADCGRALADLTVALAGIESVDIVRHASAQAEVGPLARRLAADVVIIDEIHWPPLGLRRVTDVARHAPDAAIVVLTSTPEAAWLADALRSGASAVASSGLDTPTLRQVLTEVLDPPQQPPIPMAA